MPQFMWIVIASLGSTTVMVLLALAVKRGIKASYHGGSIVIAGTGQEIETPLGRALTYVQQWTPEIQHVLFKQYLRMMKQAGADAALLADYDDARFAKALFRYLVSGGNGTQSIQKIIEHQVINGEWRRTTNHVAEFVTSQVWPLVVRVTRDFLNAEYDTTVLQKDGSRRTRWVSNTDLVDTLTGDEMKDKIVEKIVPIFRFAHDCVQAGCTE